MSGRYSRRSGNSYGRQSNYSNNNGGYDRPLTSREKTQIVNQLLKDQSQGSYTTYCILKDKFYND